MTTKRIAPGFYEHTTTDGTTYEVVRFHHEYEGKDVWYWARSGSRPDDLFYTKRNAVAALAAHLGAA